MLSRFFLFSPQKRLEQAEEIENLSVRICLEVVLGNEELKRWKILNSRLGTLSDLNPEDRR